MSMQASGGDHSSARTERELRRSLYRFDCPDAHTLGEYQLDLLGPEQRTRVAAHLVECDECRAELQTLQAFLAEPVKAPESLASRARRVVATLFVPSAGLAYGGLRGTGDSSTRIFEAGDLTLTLAPGPGSGSLIGLVVVPGSPPEALLGRRVRLLPRDGQPIDATLDELGNFELTDLRPGPYALEIDLPEAVVVVEELRVD